MRSSAAAIVAALVIAAACTTAHAKCELAPQGEGRVTHIIDARTFRLDDGREVRLAGIETNIYDYPADKASSALAALIQGRDVVLQGDTDRPDRYGRQSAVVFLAGADKSIQSELLARGGALLTGAVPFCLDEWRTAENAARRTKTGVWAKGPVQGSVTKKAESPGDILGNVGRMTVVEGKILSARQAGATFYINFGRRWTRDFAVTISRRMMPSFEASGFSFKALEGKTVRVRGFIETRGGPRIELTGIGQIEMLGTEDVTAAGAAKGAAPGGKD